MIIGTIGAGGFAQAFAKRVLTAGHKVKMSNSRRPDSLRETVKRLGPGATAVAREEAVACEMVLPFISADDNGAKKQVPTLLEDSGYSVVDLGNLRDGGVIQQAGGPIAGRDFFEKGEYHK